jgi:hypothetical protein
MQASVLEIVFPEASTAVAEIVSVNGPHSEVPPLLGGV